MEKKVCPKCNIEKNKLGGFYPDPSKKDGYMTPCIDCEKKRVNERNKQRKQTIEGDPSWMVGLNGDRF